MSPSSRGTRAAGRQRAATSSGTSDLIGGGGDKCGLSSGLRSADPQIASRLLTTSQDSHSSLLPRSSSFTGPRAYLSLRFPSFAPSERRPRTTSTRPSLGPPINGALLSQGRSGCTTWTTTASSRGRRCTT